MAALVPTSLRRGIQQPTKTIRWSFTPGEGVLDGDGMPLRQPEDAIDRCSAREQFCIW